MIPHHKKFLHTYTCSFYVCMGEMISKIWIGCSNMRYSFTWIYTQIKRTTLHRHTQNLLEKVKACTCTPKYWFKKQCYDFQWMWLLKPIVLFILEKKLLLFFRRWTSSSTGHEHRYGIKSFPFIYWLHNSNEFHSKWTIAWELWGLFHYIIFFLLATFIK